jgi:nucleoside-diphosphate-sugar epimerase
VRALVAGGAGFIGSNLCERLLDDGWSVVCLDNLITGRERNIAHLANRDFEFVRHDLIEPLPVLPNVDRIYNLASPASPPSYLRWPIETMRVNSEGARHLLELAEKTGARYLYASTSEVYGDPIDHPQNETARACTNPQGPRSMYHEAKRYGEALTRAFATDRGLDSRVVRIFNTYGPHSDPADGRIVPNLAWQALHGRPLTVYGDGSQTRSLCYVSDLVEGLVRVMEDGATGELFTLGNPEEHTVLEFARMIATLVGNDGHIEHLPPITDEDPRRRRPDITKAREVLDWEPRVALIDGLRQTIAYFQQEAGHLAGV